MSNISFEKKHILIISDDVRIFVEIKMGLMQCFDVSFAADSAAAVAALSAYPVAAIVIYIGESRDKAFSTFSDIHERVSKEGIPVILFAENDDEDDEIAAFSLGAADYDVRRRGTFQALISRIDLRITASESARRRTDGEVDARASAASPEAILSGKTILVVDDIELNREIIAAMFSEIEGLCLNFACDGLEAVEKFAENPLKYSLIFMDLHMPRMNGLDAAKAIRGLHCENAREIPIIALTASAEEDEIMLCHEAGMNHFIEKPMAHDKLINASVKYCL